MKILVFGIFLFTSLTNGNGAIGQSSTAFSSGQEYSEKSNESKQSYVEGLLDQWFLMLAIYDDEDTSLWLDDCTRELSNRDLLTVFDLWLAEHPGDLETSASYLFVIVVADFCLEY